MALITITITLDHHDNHLDQGDGYQVLMEDGSLEGGSGEELIANATLVNIMIIMIMMIVMIIIIVIIMMAIVTIIMIMTTNLVNIMIYLVIMVIMMTVIIAVDYDEESIIMATNMISIENFLNMMNVTIIMLIIASLTRYMSMVAVRKSAMLLSSPVPGLSFLGTVIVFSYCHHSFIFL